MEPRFFEFLYRTPQNDEEVNKALEMCCQGDYPHVLSSAQGLYKVRRLQGDSLSEAYEKVLQALAARYIDPAIEEAAQ